MGWYKKGTSEVWDDIYNIYNIGLGGRTKLFLEEAHE